MNCVLDQLSIASTKRVPQASLPKFLAAMASLAIPAGIQTFAMTSYNAPNRDFICYWAAG